MIRYHINVNAQLLNKTNTINEMSIKFQLIRVWFTFISGITMPYIARRLAAKSDAANLLVSTKLARQTAISKTTA